MSAAAAAAAALARAEAVGLRLHLCPSGRVHWRCPGAPPPAELLAELRRHRDGITRLLAERLADLEAGAGRTDAPYAPYAAAADALHHVAQVDRPQAERGGGGLAGIAKALRSALADGAERKADPDGWLILVRPDGQRYVVVPPVVAQLKAAGLLPAMPEARDTVEAARCARPPSWWDTEDTPQPGDRCHCGGRRWWREARAPHGWRCAACHPPGDLGPCAVMEVVS